MRRLGWIAIVMVGLAALSMGWWWGQQDGKGTISATMPVASSRPDIPLGVIAGGPQGFASRSSKSPYAGSYMGVRFLNARQAGKGILAHRYLRWEIEPCSGGNTQRGESWMYTRATSNGLDPEHPRYPFYYPLMNLDGAAVLAGVKFDRDADAAGQAPDEDVRRVRKAEVPTRGQITATWRFQFNSSALTRSAQQWIEAALGNEQIVVGWDETAHHSWLGADAGRQTAFDQMLDFWPEVTLMVQFDWDASTPTQRFRTWQSEGVRYVGQPTRLGRSPQGPILRQGPPDKDGWTEWTP